MLICVFHFGALFDHLRVGRSPWAACGATLSWLKANRTFSGKINCSDVFVVFGRDLRSPACLLIVVRFAVLGTRHVIV